MVIGFIFNIYLCDSRLVFVVFAQKRGRLTFCRSKKPIAAPCGLLKPIAFDKDIKWGYT